MLRTNLVQLFELDNPSANLYELVEFLPIYAVTSINGVIVEEIETFDSMQSAHNKIASLKCLTEMSEDGTNNNTTPQHPVTTNQQVPQKNDNESEIIEGMNDLKTIS